MGGNKTKGNTGKARSGKATSYKKVIDSRVDAPRFEYLVWRFGRLDHHTDFACLGLKESDVRELEEELAILQREKISELERKRWLKFIDRGDMTQAGQKALDKASHRQESGLWQLHLKRHKWRIWGYFDRPEFFFLFWDEDHAIATGKSRTRRS